MITVVKPGAELITDPDYLLDCAKLIETAGRTCYKSEERTTHKSADRFVRSIIKQGHESVIEHCSVTYRITCSRACSHQLVRHRLGSYSQESQRYCDYGKLGFQIIMPPSIEKDPVLKNIFLADCEDAYGAYCQLRKQGVPPEDARFVLPNASKTEVVTTYNLRMWRHVLKERWLNKHAQWEIRQVMNEVAYELDTYLPVFFEDIIKRMPSEIV